VHPKTNTIVYALSVLFVLGTMPSNAPASNVDDGYSQAARKTRVFKSRTKRLDRAARSLVGRPESAPSPSNAAFAPPFYLEDLALFIECVVSPGNPGCAEVDFNGDTLFNVLDYYVFQREFAGILGPDCNGNRIPDSDDVAAGSPDRNGNDVPDECEESAVAFGQGPSGTPAAVPSNIDWSDSDPNAVAADDFLIVDGSAILGVSWWGAPVGPAAPGVPPDLIIASGAPAREAVPTAGPSLSISDVQAARRVRSAGGAQPTGAGGPAPADVAGGGDTCAQATVINTIPFSDTGDTCGMTDDYDEVCDPNVNFPGSPDVAYRFTPGASGTFDISLCGNSNFDTKLYVYEATCPTGGSPTGNTVACNEDFCDTPSFGLPFVSATIQVPMTGGTTYFIVIDGTDSDCGRYTLDIVQACAPSEIDCFAAHPSPGCGDAECCAIVCDEAVDPFCCDPGGGQWDSICVGEAFSLCGNPPPPPSCPAGTLFGQPASHVVEGWIAGVSDAGWFDGPLRRFETFDGVGEPICDVHWWGLNVFNDGLGGGFTECTKTPDDYQVTFYNDALGEPDLENPVCTYTVTPRKIDTGLRYDVHPLYEYAVDLDTCCVIESGWVSVQGIDAGTDCLFSWMSHGDEGGGSHFIEDVDGSLVAQNYDLGVCLTGFSGWFLSFHEALADASPAGEALGVYFCPAELVTRTSADLEPCDAPTTLKYDVDLGNCCLIHSNVDGRNETMPATPGVFRASAELGYDLDIQAVTGVRFSANLLTGACVESLTGNGFAEDFWAWHTTDIESASRAPLTGTLGMGGLGEWLYGPWSLVGPTCGGGNMAFELLTLELPASE